jgi:hypothetical protein
VKWADWPRGDIDRFLLAALEARGLGPVADADRTRLSEGGGTGFSCPFRR